MPDSALNRRSEALGGWKANNASFGHQIIPRTLFTTRDFCGLGQVWFCVTKSPPVAVT